MRDDYFPFRAGCVSDGFFPDFKNFPLRVMLSNTKAASSKGAKQ